LFVDQKLLFLEKCRKNVHTIGCITPFITLHITHVSNYSFNIKKNQVYLLITDGYVQRYEGKGEGAAAQGTEHKRQTCGTALPETMP